MIAAAGRGPVDPDQAQRRRVFACGPDRLTPAEPSGDRHGAAPVFPAGPGRRRRRRIRLPAAGPAFGATRPLPAASSGPGLPDAPSTLAPRGPAAAT